MSDTSSKYRCQKSSGRTAKQTSLCPSALACTDTHFSKRGCCCGAAVKGRRQSSVNTVEHSGWGLNLGSGRINLNLIKWASLRLQNGTNSSLTYFHIHQCYGPTKWDQHFGYRDNRLQSKS